MGFFETLRAIGDCMQESTREKTIEELCNSINNDTFVISKELADRELRERLKNFELDELLECYDEYSRYRVKNAAKIFLSFISSKLYSLKNRELFELYDEYAEDEELRYELKHILTSRGCL